MIEESVLAKLQEWFESEASVLDPTNTVKIACVWVPALVTEVRALQAMFAFQDLFKDEPNDQERVPEQSPASPSVDPFGDDVGGISLPDVGDRPVPPSPAPAPRGRRGRSDKAKAKPKGRSKSRGDSGTTGRDTGELESSGGELPVGGGEGE